MRGQRQFKPWTAVLICCTCCLVVSAASAQTTHYVSQVGPTFDPPSVVIATGDIVEWSWSSGSHTVTSGTSCVFDGLFTSPLTSGTPTFSYTFTSAGVFPYFCEPHCQSGMTGSVRVVDPPECAPTADGSACEQVECPDSTEVCHPRCVFMGDNGGTITDCDCRPSTECWIAWQPGEDPYCAGDCPDGTHCEQSITTTPDGDEICCDCVPDEPQVCEPTPDGTDCEPNTCTAPGDLCRPRCVREELTGQITVLDCDCGSEDECHVVHDLGIPPFCEGGCPPGEVCFETRVTNADGTVDICCDCQPDLPTECEPTPDGLDCEPVVCPDPTDECRPRCLLLDSTGGYSVLDCDCRGIDDCHIELVPGAEPQCVGECPPGQVCHQTIITTPIGTQVCCECVDDPPACEPTADEQACKSYACPEPGEECRPRCIREDVASGTFSVLDCGCRSVDTCYAEYDPAVGAFCQSDCPPGYTCVENRVDNGDGTVDICCDCVRIPCKCPGDINGDLLINGLDIQGFIRCLLGMSQPSDNCTCADMNEDGWVDMLDVWPFVQVLLASEPCFPAACPPEDLWLTIGTGVDDDGTLIPFGSDDDDWAVTVDAAGGIVPRPAKVISPNPAWLTIPGTRWISANSTGPNGDYHYEFCFCLDARFQSPELFLQLRADDRASVYLNGSLIGSTPATYSFNTPQPTAIYENDPDLFLVGENCVTVVVSNTHGVVTGLNLSGFVSAKDGKCCCDAANLDHELDSGVDDSGGLISIGSNDDDWNVIVDASGGTVPRPATVITPNSAWLTIPGTRWISASSTGPNGLYVYEQCFCLDPRFENAQLTLDLRADDRATVWLNGVQVGATPVLYSFNTPQPTHVFVTNQELFLCGENCIEIHVVNSHGVVTGVNIAGQITADNGLCCCAPSDDGSECCPEECENPEETCMARCMRINLQTDERTVIDCACRETDRCHVAQDFPPQTMPACLGECPPGEMCVNEIIYNDDGTVDICCDCEPMPPLGACCLPNGYCADGVNSTICEAHNGVYLGDESLCQGDEACCLPDGTCINVDVACCELLYQGQPQGLGVFCLGDLNGNGLDDLCEDPPAQLSCCEEQVAFCWDLLPGETECPLGSTLVIGPCGTQTQACCLPTGECVDEFVACCWSMGGVPQGAGTDCTTVECPSAECGPNATATACKQVECPNPDEKCVPTCVTIDPVSGTVENLDCECNPWDECFVEVSPAPVLSAKCVNVCPDGMTCEQTEYDNPDGTYTICCDCVPIEPTGSCCDQEGTCIPEPVGGCPTGTTYHPDPCEPVQACCLPDDTCVDLEPQCCEDQGGTVTAGLCTGTLSGCCLPDGSCVDIDRACCWAQNGEVLSSGCQPVEACCFEPPYAPICIDTNPDCCLAAGGNPQGSGTYCLGDLDGDGVDDACDDSSPEICPLPSPPEQQLCVNMQATDCVMSSPTGGTCLQKTIVIDPGVPGGFWVHDCGCVEPDGCGAIEIEGDIVTCPGGCPPDERCTIFLNGVPQEVPSIIWSSLPADTVVTCDCDVM